jgi:sigma-E factor negative regulatory protein RseC
MNGNQMTATIPSTASSSTVESIARVVRVDGAFAWLEPEQTTSCGNCASSAACGAIDHGPTGIGTVARRIEARRFKLDNPSGASRLQEGERIVVGVDNRALIKASLVAYALPLMMALGGGGIAQDIYGSDPVTMLGTAIGMLSGLLAARFAARHLSRRGDLAPHFLRRARPDETCGTNPDRP